MGDELTGSGPAPAVRVAESRAIAAAGALLAAMYGLSRVAGYVRDVLIAHQFGTSGAADLYALAFNAPDLLTSLILAGAVSSAFVPVLTERLARDQVEEARAVMNGVMTGALFLLLAGVAILQLVAPLIIGVVAASRTPQERQLALTLTRIILIQPIFIGLGGFSIGVMNAHKRFRVISLPPLVYNLALIFAVLFFVHLPPHAPMGIVGLAWGVALGGVLHLGVQVPSLRSLGWRLISLRDLRHPGVWQVARLMVPISIGLTASQVNVFVDRYLAAGLPQGQVIGLYYANNLAAVPIGVFTSAFAVVMFPYFARHATLGEVDELRRRASLAVRLNLFVMVPAAVGLIVLGPQIIALLFQHGAFGQGSTSTVYPPLAFFAIGVAAQASVFIVVRVYYSFQEVLTPMKIAFAAVFVNLVANLILVHPLGAGGLALGTSLAAILNFSLLAWGLRPRLHGFEGRTLALSLLRVAGGCVAMALVAYGTWHVLAGSIPLRLDLRHYAILALAILLAGVAYLGVEIALRSEEAGIALQVLRRRPVTL